jgi:hypothetical protein
MHTHTHTHTYSYTHILIHPHTHTHAYTNVVLFITFHLSYANIQKNFLSFYFSLPRSFNLNIFLFLSQSVTLTFVFFSPCLFHFNSLSLLPLSSFVFISFIYLSLLPLSSSLSLFLASIFLSSPSTPLYPYFFQLSFSPPLSLFLLSSIITFFHLLTSYHFIEY